MKRALDELRVEGIATTAPFHKRVLSHNTFIDGMVDTGFVERELLSSPE
jgi:acetyl-CoA carboxylase biotin carboxylase subunit